MLSNISKIEDLFIQGQLNFFSIHSENWPTPVPRRPTFGKLLAIKIKTGSKGFDFDHQGTVYIRICGTFERKKKCCSTQKLDNTRIQGEFSRYRTATFKDKKTLFNCYRIEFDLLNKHPQIDLYFQSHKNPHLAGVHWSVDQITLKFDSAKLLCENLENFASFGPGPKRLEFKDQNLCRIPWWWE